MFKGMKKIVHKMGQSIRKMKFIKRTLVSCTLGFAAVLVGSIVFENLYYWGASHGGFLIGLGLAASQFVVYKDDIDRLVANAKGKGSKGSAEQAERQAAPQGKEPAMTLEEESKNLGDEFAVVGADADDGDLPEEEFRD